MDIVWQRRALADLDRIHQWLVELPHGQPDRAIARIERAANGLAHRDTGRPSRLEGQRELSVPDQPYVLVYSVTPAAVEILAVFHTSEDR